jgi:hypothetical protein
LQPSPFAPPPQSPPLSPPSSPPSPCPPPPAAPPYAPQSFQLVFAFAVTGDALNSTRADALAAAVSRAVADSLPAGEAPVVAVSVSETFRAVASSASAGLETDEAVSTRETELRAQVCAGFTGSSCRVILRVFVEGRRRQLASGRVELIATLELDYSPADNASAPTDADLASALAATLTDVSVTQTLHLGLNATATVSTEASTAGARDQRTHLPALPTVAGRD